MQRQLSAAEAAWVGRFVGIDPSVLAGNGTAAPPCTGPAPAPQAGPGAEPGGAAAHPSQDRKPPKKQYVVSVPAGPVGTFTDRAIAAINKQRVALGLAGFTSLLVQDGKSGSWLPSDEWARAWAASHGPHGPKGKPAVKMPSIPLTYTTDEERAEAAAHHVLATVDVTADPAPIEMADIPVQDNIVLQSTAQDDVGASPDDPLHPAWQEGHEFGLANPLPLFGDVSPVQLLRYKGDESIAYGNGVKAGRKAAASLPALTPLPDAKGADDSGKIAIGGLPTFRYNFRPGPILHRVVTGPAGDLLIELALTGSLTLTFANPPPFVSLNVDNLTWRAEALKALRPIASGVRINGIGSDAPSIGAVTQNAITFQRQETRFTPPSTISYSGQVAVGYKVKTDLSLVEVRGDAAALPGFVLSLTFTPRPPKPAVTGQPVAVPEPSAIRNLNQFMEAHGAQIAAVAVVAGIIVVAILTDGAGLVLFAAA